MENLKKIYCRYDMVCEAPTGGGVEIIAMPHFFTTKPIIETQQSHVHNFYEIVWFTEGEGVHTVDFSDYPVAPGTLFFVAPGQVHSFGADYEGQRGYVIKICSDLMGETCGADLDNLRYRLLDAGAVPTRRLDTETAARLERIVAQLREENALVGAVGHKDYLRALVRMLVINIERACESCADVPAPRSSTAQSTFVAFRRLIDQQHRRLHSVKEYASLLGVSTKTLTNHVAECSPHSPLEIINARLVLEAKRMLRYSNMMVKEIAFELGFDDPSYFVKFFKRHTGQLPADFRSSSQQSAPACGCPND